MCEFIMVLSFRLSTKKKKYIYIYIYINRWISISLICINKDTVDQDLGLNIHINVFVVATSIIENWNSNEIWLIANKFGNGTPQELATFQES